MEFFRNTNIDFLGKKWYFLAFSLIFSVAGLVSMGHRWATTGSPLPLGVDFRGGTLVYVKFTHPPNDNEVRAKLAQAGLKGAQSSSASANSRTTNCSSRSTLRKPASKRLMRERTKLSTRSSSNPDPNKKDLNNASAQTIGEFLLTQDPLRAGTDAAQQYQNIAQQIVVIRDKQFGGAIDSFDKLSGVPAPVLQSMQQGFYLSNFGVRNVEIVGPQVGQQLQAQARRAVLYSLAGMLIYPLVPF